ncbi:MAG: DNA polymerase III subunit delta [Ginsengibacter sp.]
MQFSDIIGQDNIKDKLVQLVRHNRLSHALLFLGKEGNGDLALALAFAQYIVCTSAKSNSQTNSPSLFGETLPQPEIVVDKMIDSCGVCPACKKAAALVHPDIHFSYPVIPKKSGEAPVSSDYITEWREFIAGYPYGNVYDWLQFLGAENKQGNITARESNEINRKLTLKSFESNYKILIMWLPEYLGKEGNKLLKLIEEPPVDTIFLFVAENEDAILPTILSRTQLVKIPTLADVEIKDALINRAEVIESKASQIAAVANGNYREALHLLQHAEDDWQETARDWLKVINRQRIPDQVKWIEDISKIGREKQKQFLLYFIHMCQQAIRLNVNSQASMPESELDFAQRLNKLCSLEAQEAIVEELNKACYFIERNAHAKMLFHALTIRIYHIIKDNSLILIN